MLLHVHVHPRAHKTAIREWIGDVLHISVCASPKENEANLELLRFLSELLDIPKTSLELVRGHRGRTKQISIPDSAQPALRERTTGSNPPREHGLQRSMRQSAIQPPRKTP